MDAVGRIDLQAAGPVLAGREFVDPGRAEALLRAVVKGQVHLHRGIVVLERQVTGLVLLVVGVGEIDRRELVEGDLAVGLGVGDLRRRRGFFQRRVVLAVVQGPRRPPPQQIGVHRRIGETGPESPAEGRADVARPVKLVPDPGLFQRLGVGGQPAVPRPGDKGGEGGLRRRHARLHGGVRALDPGYVHEPRRGPDQRPAGEGQLGYGLEAAFVERPRPVGEAPAALEQRPHGRVGLEPLHLVERTEVRVLVIQADDEADGHLVVLQVIDERAAVGAAVQGPADGVDDQSRLVPGRVHLPQLLDADAVGLGIGAVVEVEALDQGLGKGPPAAFGEERVFGAQLDAGLMIGRRPAVPAQPHVAGGDALDRAVSVVQDLGRGEAGVDLRPQGLGLGAQPAAQDAQADDVVAAVFHLRRDGQADGAAFGEQKEPVLARRRVQRRATVLPLRDQLVQRAGIEDGAGKDMRPHLRPLLDHADGDLAAVLGAQLAKPDRRRQTRRAGAHDDHVELHGFPFHRRVPQTADRCQGRRYIAQPSTRLHELSPPPGRPMTTFGRIANVGSWPSRFPRVNFSSGTWRPASTRPSAMRR